MKKISFLFLCLISSFSYSQTKLPPQLISPSGSTSGQVIASTGPSSAPIWGNISSGSLAAIASNSVLGNISAFPASPTALSVPSCAGSTAALSYVSGSGFSCNSSINAVSIGGATFSSPGSIGNTVAGSGAFTTLSASSTVSGAGFSAYLASPPAIGSTAESTGKFTTLQSTSTTDSSSTSTGATTTAGGIGVAKNAFVGGSINAAGNDALNYTTTNPLSLTTGIDTVVTTLVKQFDRVNANFNGTTGVFTVPANGIYQVCGMFILSSAVNVPGAIFFAAPAVNGNYVPGAGAVVYQQSSATQPTSLNFCSIVQANASDLITVKVAQTTGSTRTLDTSGLNHISINRIP